MIRRTLIAASAVGFLSLAPMAVSAEDVGTGNSSETYRLLNLFGDAFERVRADYVEEVSDRTLIENAINGMLTQLDPHSSFLNEKAFRDMQVQTRGEFGGLGIEVTMENGLVKVVSPIEDTPAARAGLLPNDFIVQLDGEAVMGLSLTEAVDRMRGPVGSEVRLGIRRGDREPFDVSLKRAVIKIQSVRSRIDGDIGYIRITSFNEQTDETLKDAIAKIRKELGKKLKGYVLDLRNNPGGLLDQALAVSDAFLEKGEIVSTRSRRPEDAQRHNAHAGDLTDGAPVLVLINSGSASASEIVAGALQDHHRATIMGTKSFGKGSVQTIIPLAGHVALRLTTARYYTPSGRSIQAVGIEPDIKIQQKIDVAAVEGGATSPAAMVSHRRREADLRGALRNDGLPPEKGEKAAKAGDADKAGDKATDKESTQDDDVPVVPKEPEKDFQLQRALDYLHGINV